MEPHLFFSLPKDPVHRRYEALRAFYLDRLPAAEVAARYGFTASTVYSIARDFKKLLVSRDPSRGFFLLGKPGRKRNEETDEIEALVISLRKQYLSVPDIKATLDAKGIRFSERQIHNVVRREGFKRLPRRTKVVRSEAFSGMKLDASVAAVLDFAPEAFQTQNSAGVLCLLPFIRNFGIHSCIEKSSYPETKTIPRLNSILSFVALKLSNVQRYSRDDLWCMDRGLGLFAGLNVLPKTAWFTSYSHRVTREMNRSFLRSLNSIWSKHGLLGDTANLDFTTIPYWGNDSHLENNWSGTRHKAISSILAALAHDPDSGIITYGNTTKRHKDKDDTVLEFLDFYSNNGGDNLKYLVFDSKFTKYENLRRLDDQGIHFLTIRRRGKNIVSRIQQTSAAQYKDIRVPSSDGKTRALKVLDEIAILKDYGKELRQIVITGHGKIKPALIITNDFDLKLDLIVRKYARRWLVEKEISEQIEFFHLNKVSSSMVIKVDFDLTMTILAHNLYRLFAQELPGYQHFSAQSLFTQFIHNSADVEINENQVQVSLKKKRTLPALLTAMAQTNQTPIPWLGNRQLVFSGASRS